jgi:DNA replication protein DnaC
MPRKDGIAGNVAVACECGVEERAEKVMDRARIPKRYQDCSFENYNVDLEDGKTYTAKDVAELKKAKIIAEKFVDNYPGGDQAGLLLMGTPGAGKTHLAIAALKRLIANGHPGYFCEYGALLREIQSTYKTESELSEATILAPILSCEVLVIDDLGCIKPSDWVRDTIGYILNSRYSEGSQDLSHPKCTIITTNYLEERIERSAKLPGGPTISTRTESLTDRIGDRMRSRLYEVCRTVIIQVPDFRKEIRQAGRVRV